jgi:class 3 adenylate cyclase
MPSDSPASSPTASAPATTTRSPERAATSLTEFLERHPWPAEWLRFGSPVDHFWTYDVPMPKHALWPHLTDTSTMNQRLGQPEMTFREENGRLVGSTVRAGMVMTWDEVPWQWEYEHALTNERIYRGGMLRYNRAIFEVHDEGDDACRVSIYFGGVGRSWLGWLALRYGMASMRDAFGKFFADLASAYRAQRPLVTRPPSTPLSDEVLARIDEIRRGLKDDGIGRGLADRLVAFVRDGDDDALSRIRPRELAAEWKIFDRDVVSAFLHATRRGLFVLTWDTVCPHCRGNRAQLQHLGEVPKAARCDVCEIDFDTTDAASLEVTFHVHPSIRAVEKRQYCAAEPARKPHIFVQRLVPPGETVSLATQLPVGRYRMRTRSGRTYVLLDVRATAEAEEITWRATDGGGERTTGQRPTIRVENPTDAPAMFVIESRDEDRRALRPSDLFALQDFRDLFSAEAIAADVQLDIGKQTILFTDVVGSTRYYEVVGDAAAFAVVRKHFLEAYAIVKRHGGVIVKTIGDAVMGAFTDPASALRASIEIQRFFNGKSEVSPLRLRVTIHAGRCIAVNLNSNIDYFGSTVNLAAKLQAIAGAGEIAFTPDVSEDPGVRELLEAERLPVEEVPFEMKWADERSIVAQRIRVE